MILEAYCRGSQQHMRTLVKQIKCLEKLKECLTDQVKPRKDRKTALQAFSDFLQETHCQEAISSVINPLNPSFKLKRIK